MYRPEGWKNPYPKEGRAMPENIPWVVFHDAYEAGADAMLEGLNGLTDIEILKAVKPNWEEGSEGVLDAT